jgi:hypothetical protein
MREAGGLAGVGEGERERGREGTPYQQNSIDKRFKTHLIQLPINKIQLPINKIQLPTNKIQ